MKIAEIVGSYIDDELARIAPSAALMQHIAAAFTPSGKVKAHWDAAGFGGEVESSPVPRQVRTTPHDDAIPSGAVAGLASAGEVQPVDKMHVEPVGVEAPRRQLSGRATL